LRIGVSLNGKKTRGRMARRALSFNLDDAAPCGRSSVGLDGYMQRRTGL